MNDTTGKSVRGKSIGGSAAGMAHGKAAAKQPADRTRVTRATQDAGGMNMVASNQSARGGITGNPLTAAVTKIREDHAPGPRPIKKGKA